jgi:hypothetical protein
MNDRPGAVFSGGLGWQRGGIGGVGVGPKRGQQKFSLKPQKFQGTTGLPKPRFALWLW